MPNALRSRRVGVAATFFTQGLLFITLTTHLPQTKERFDLGEVELSMVMLGMVLLAGVGSVVAEFIARRRDSATALRLGLLGLAAKRECVRYDVAGGTHGSRISQLPEPERTQARNLILTWAGLEPTATNRTAPTELSEAPLQDDLHSLGR